MNYTSPRIPVQLRTDENLFVSVFVDENGNKRPAAGEGWEQTGLWRHDDPRLASARLIALYLGDTWVDVDCDDKDGKEGVADFSRLWMSCQSGGSVVMSPDTMHITTMNGGEAWLFRQPEVPVQHRVLGRKGGLEIRAGHAKYRVIAGPGYACSSTAPSVMPESLRLAIATQPSGSSQGTAGSTGEYARAGLNNLIFTVFKAFSDSPHVSEEEARAVLLAANAAVGSPYPEDELLATALRPGIWGEPAYTAQQADWAQRQGTRKYQEIDWRKAWEAQPESIDWLWEPMLERGTSNSLYAKAKTGKSLLTQNIVLDLARKGVSVVYIDQENRVKDTVGRLKDMGTSWEELGSFHCYSFPMLPPLDTPEGGRDLFALAQEHQAELVILDTTMRLVQGHENDADTFNGLYRCSLIPLKAAEITVLRLDHPGKDEDRRQRGSSAKEGDVDTVWKMTTKVKGLVYSVEREMGRGDYECSEYVVTRYKSPVLRHEWVEKEDSATEAVAKLRGQLDDLDICPTWGRDRAGQALREAGIKFRNEHLSSAIKERKLSQDPGDS